jgi:hypothetical protein
MSCLASYCRSIVREEREEKRLFDSDRKWVYPLLSLFCHALSHRPLQRTLLPLSFDRSLAPTGPASSGHAWFSVGSGVKITCKGCLLLFLLIMADREPFSLSAKRLIPATHPTMQYYIGPGSQTTLRWVETLGVTASDISPCWKSQLDHCFQ